MKTLSEFKNIKFGSEIIDCEVCKRAKMTKVPSQTTRYRYEKPLMLVHTDVMGPISPGTYKYGAKYVVSFIDDFSRYAWAYPIVDKHSVHIAFQTMIDNAKLLLGKDASISCLRMDNGTEYMTEGMKRIMNLEKINPQTTPPYTSNLNGGAERFNRELQEKIHSLIFDSGFPKEM